MYEPFYMLALVTTPQTYHMPFVAVSLMLAALSLN